MSNIIRPIPITEFEPDRESEVAASEIHHNFRKYIEARGDENAEPSTFRAYFPIGLGSSIINEYHIRTEEKFLESLGLDVAYVRDVAPGFVETPEGARLDIERHFDEQGVLYGILYHANGTHPD